MLDLAIRGAKRGRWIPGVLESEEGEPRESTPLGLSRSERAFQRALYYDGRVHKARKATAGRWSLKVSWGEVIGRRRMLRIRVFSDTSGARRVRAEGTKADSYIKNPALRSTFAMDQQEGQVTRP